MNKYDSYKDSGIDWIGEIPSHWDTFTLKQVSHSIRNGYVGPTKDILVETGIPYIQSLHVKDGKIIFERGEYYVSREWGLKHPKIHTDNLVIVQTGDIGQVALVPEDFNGCNCHALIIVVCDLGKCKPTYLSYYLRSSTGKELMLLTKTGATLPHLNSGSICNTQIILPPLAEQEAIAAWLDRKCGDIDAAIAKVDREIELIEELKQSEISRVVTRGLNPDAKLRPSGIDWIGDVPEHWKIQNGKYLLNILPGFPADSSLFVNEGEGFPLIRIRDINSDKTEVGYAGIVPEEYIIRKGDVLVGMDGDFNISRWKGPEALLNQRVCRVSGSKKYREQFAFYMLPKLLKRINDVTYATTVKHLSTYDISNSKIPLPPLSEQQEIANYLDRKCAEIDELKAKLTKKRDTLKELRQAIISEVVTGKRKVIL